MKTVSSLILWNIAWASGASSRGQFFAKYFAEHPSDVICLTEGYADVLPTNGYVITSEEDYGYPLVFSQH